MEDMPSIDLYELLDILPSVTPQEIKKAYRKKALKCHPDKNPDNPKAAELFHQLSRALEILLDDSARAAYDKVINAKKAAAHRNKELDSKRKKLKEDLEARERQAQFVSTGTKEISAEEKLKAEIDRLRKEGSKQLEEEIEFVRSQIQKEKFSSAESTDPSCFRLKLSWKILNESDCTYNKDVLTKIFSKYGDISALVVSSKRKGSALLEFVTSTAAVKAHRLEKGFVSNPLLVNWLSGTPPLSEMTSKPYDKPVRDCKPCTPGTSIFPSMPMSSKNQYSPNILPETDIFQIKGPEKQDEDFESLVLSRMRQAEESKRRAEAVKTEANKGNSKNLKIKIDDNS